MGHLSLSNANLLDTNLSRAKIVQTQLDGTDESRRQSIKTVYYWTLGLSTILSHEYLSLIICNRTGINTLG